MRLRAKVIEVEKKQQRQASDELSAYAFRTHDFIVDKLGWIPWASGDPNNPGQKEIIDAYERILRTQWEKQQYDLGNVSDSKLEYYKPGETIKYILRIPKGYNTGGTKLASGLVIHLLNCFPDSIIQSYAPPDRDWETVVYT